MAVVVFPTMVRLLGSMLVTFQLEPRVNIALIALSVISFSVAGCGWLSSWLPS